MFRRIRTVLEMIKFEHSVFALPYALVAALLAARTEGPGGGWPAAGRLAWQLSWIVVAMVGARSAAMTMNRIADLRYDRAESAHARAARSSPGSCRPGSRGVSRCSARRRWCWRPGAESAGISPLAGGAGGALPLFVHETLHDVVASRAWFLPGHVACGGLDCHARFARLANADSVRRGDAVGGRLRRALRLPGRRLRSRSGTALDSAAASASSARSSWRA